VVSRRDLTPSYQSVQSGHAAIMFQYEHFDIAKKWYNESNYLIYLSVENESELEQLIQKLQKSNLKYSTFRESDIDNQITAICIEPSEKTRKVTSSMPLLLKEFSTEKLMDKNNYKFNHQLT
jgi:peptidyl-tRNA hydrolase